MAINEKIVELKMQGNCCSQIVMQMSLDAMGKDENPDLLAAMKGLCGGIHCGKTCGALTAAVCAIYLANPEHAQELAEELLDWFEDVFGETDCSALLDENPANKAERCPIFMDSVFKKLQELMDWDDDESRVDQ